MNCKKYKWLYLLVPIPQIRAAIIDKHFDSCPRCAEELGQAADLNYSLFSSREWVEEQDLWPAVRKEILDSERRLYTKPKLWGLKPRQWVFASLLLLVALLLVPLLLNMERVPVSTNENRKIIIKSIKVENQPARGYYFKSKDKDKLFVWVQKT